MQQLELFPINLRDTLDMEIEARLVEERNNKIEEAWMAYENSSPLQEVAPSVSELGYNIWWPSLLSMDYIEQYCPKGYYMLMNP